MQETHLSPQDHRYDPKQLQLLAAAFQYADTGILIAEHGESWAKITFVNPSLCEMSGYTEAELIGQAPGMLLSPVQKVKIFQTLIEKQYFRGEVMARHKDGSEYPLDLRISPIKEEDKITHWVAVHRNITTEKRTEAALSENEQMLEMMNDMLPAAMVITRFDDSVILYANEHYSKLLGVPGDQLIQTPAKRFYADPSIRPRLIELVETQGVVDNYELQLRSADGEVFWANYSLRKMHLHGEKVLVGSFTDITERKAAVEALMRSEKNYFNLINSIDGIIWKADARNFSAFYISPQVERILGYAPAQALELPSMWEKHMHPDDWEYSRKAIRKAIASGQGYELEYRITAADERMVWIREIVNIVAEDDFPKAIGTMVDITEYKRAQAAELKQRRLAEALRDTTTALTSTLDQEKVLDGILTHLASFIPYDVAHISLIEGGMTYIVRAQNEQEFFGKLDRKIYEMPIANTPTLRYMIENNSSIVVKDTEQDERWVYVAEGGWIRAYLGTPIRLQGQIIGFLHLNSTTPGAFTDDDAHLLETFAIHAAIALRNALQYTALENRVTERTAELRLERERLQAILDGTADAILYNEGNEVLFANKAATLLTGYTIEEFIGQDARMLLPDDISSIENHIVEHQIHHKLHHDELWHGELRVARKDGSIFDADIVISLTGSQTESGQVGSVIVLRDISQEKVLQAQKARFVAHASHELRTPLTNLTTRLYLLRRKPERLPEHLEILEEVAGRMRRLIEDLLDVSRFERGVIVIKPQRIDLAILAAGVIRMQVEEATAKHITLTYHAPATPTYVVADPERIIQVITNLVMNAINYTPEGGKVSLSVGSNGGDALICVEDNGIGIAEEHMPHIFQPFYRVEGDLEGTGLGLSIAHDIIELHHGRIEVHSHPGQGSQFTVYLPGSKV